MLCLERQVNDLRFPLAKSKPAKICQPGVLAAKRASATILWRKSKDERKAASSKNLDRQEDEALVGGRQVSSDRSHLSHMAGAKKLCASLCPVPTNYAEARAERVLGFLTRWHSSRKVLSSGLLPVSEMA